MAGLIPPGRGRYGGPRTRGKNLEREDSSALGGFKLGFEDQVGGKRDQSAHRREVPRSSTMSPNDLEHDDAEGWCKTAMNYTVSRIAELKGDTPS
uniref:Uncharacterized protein n=1 Tax=Solanum tuberosum TaxID=4113 RepID=M1C8B8_SOLTU